jgi:hypothetical protein
MLKLQEKLQRGYQDRILHIELKYQIGAQHFINSAIFKIVINIEVNSLLFNCINI